MEIKYSEHVKLVVDITDEMERDWRECRKLMELKDEGKDCNNCSLGACVEGVGICEIIWDELNRRTNNEKQ